MNRFIIVGLKFIGAWPGSSSSIYLFILFGLFVTSLIFQIWNITIVFNKLDLLMNNLGTTMPVLSVVLKLAMFRLEYRSVKYMINEIIYDLKHEKETSTGEIMKRNIKISVYLSNAIAISYNALIVAYLIMAIMAYDVKVIENRQFVMQATFPGNAKVSPIFETICILQFTVSIFGANGHSILEGLLTVSVLHANTKAYGVCKEISKFSKTCLNSDSREEIMMAKKKLIKKHVNFINFTECIQEVYAYVAFFHLIVMTLINCIVGYMLISFTSVNGDNIFTFLMCIAYIFTALSAVASYCIAGEYLTSQGKMIYDSLYDCPWYRFKPVDIRTLAFMTMKSRQPVTITFGNFCNLSLQYFTQVLKTSASYLSLVRASMK